MLTGSTRVRRDGRVQQIDIEDVVPGDIVLAEAGDRLPADGRLVAAHSAEIDESALTGESQPVAKKAGVVMDDPPRHRADAILTWRRFGNLFLHGLTMAVGTLFAFQRDLREHGESHGLTMAFSTFVLFQVFNALNARDEHRSILRRASLCNWRLWAALAAVVALQFAAVYWPPAQSLFRTHALGAVDWLVAATTAAGILVVEELRKLVMSSDGVRREVSES